eukprot:Pgem_evm4s18257
MVKNILKLNNARVDQGTFIFNIQGKVTDENINSMQNAVKSGFDGEEQNPLKGLNNDEKKKRIIENFVNGGNNTTNNNNNTKENNNNNFKRKKTNKDVSKRQCKD